MSAMNAAETERMNGNGMAGTNGHAEGINSKTAFADTYGYSQSTAAEIYRTSGLMALISAFILVEGVVRTADQVSTPGNEWTGNNTTFPPVVLLVGGAVEVLFGLTGLGVSLAQLVFNAGSTLATWGTVVAQCLGWFTFAVYTTAAPAWSTRASGSLFPGLTATESNAIVAMGVLGNITYCFCLQGAQFFLAFKLAKLQAGMGHIYTPEYHRSRLVIFTIMVLVAGGAQIAAGAILDSSSLGGGQYAMPVVEPPYMVFWPQLTITIGSIVFIYGLILLAFALRFFPAQRGTGLMFGMLGAFVFICHLAFQNLGQSFGGMILIIVNTELVGLNFTLSFFPAYLAGMLSDNSMLVAPEQDGQV